MAEVGSPGGGSSSMKSARSGTSSQAGSHSSLNKVLEIELNYKTELFNMDEEEQELKVKIATRQVDILALERVIQDQKDVLNDRDSWRDDKEGVFRRSEIERIGLQLTTATTEKEKLEIDLERKKRSNQFKKQLLEDKLTLQKNIIEEENEQALSSDDDQETHTVITDKDDLKDVRIQDFVNQAAAETEKLHLDLEDQKRKQEAEAEKAHVQRRLELEDLLSKQKVKAELALQQAKEEAMRHQLELDQKAAEAVEEQFKIERELRNLSRSKAGSTHSVVITDPPPDKSVNNDERLINMFAEAIARSSALQQPAHSSSENNKFLARYSDKGLPTFHGKPEDWPYFHACFETSTKEGGLSNATNMGRLGKALQGEAREHVKDMMLSPDNVPEIIEALKKRFGQPKHIIQAMRVKIENVPPVLIDDASTIIVFGAAVRNFTAIVKTLECPEYMANPDLLDALEKKLPDLTKISWLTWLKATTGSRNLEHFAKWINEQAGFACEICPPFPISEVKPPSKKEPVQQEKKKGNEVGGKKESNIPTAAGLFVGEKKKCIFCGKHPFSADCWLARDMSLTEKQKIIKENKCCLNCLKPGHWAKECQQHLNCVLCGKNHVPLMCPDSRKPPKNDKLDQTPPPSPQQQQVEPSTSESGKVTSTNLACSSNTFLPTLMAKVHGKNGWRSIRILVDSGSERSYVLKSLVKELGLSPNGDEKIIHSLFGGVQTQPKTYQRYEVDLISNNGDGSMSLNVLEADCICGPINRVTRGPWMKDLRRQGVWLSDFGPNPNPIGLLIGSDGIREFYEGKIVELANGLTAIQTILGWTVQGKSENLCVSSMMCTQSMSVQTLTAMEVPLSQFWDLEAIGIQDPADQKTKQEKEIIAKKHFMETVTRSEDGRYVVSLPWIDGRPTIPNNKRIAEKRLDSTTRSLMAKGQFHNYDKLFKEWEQESFIEEVPKEEEESPSHYIPHRAVFKSESLTTPIRPVFDASCKAPRTPSLNECMEKGPNLLELIPSILLRFREKQIGLISDIRKAFQMIDINKEDQDFLRFLWWEDDSQRKLKIYRHRRVVFGVNSSPFLLAAVLEQHLTSVDPQDQVVAAKLLRSLYVDNCVTSEDTFQEVLDFKKWSTGCLAEAKMDLRSWECGFVEESGIGLLASSECGLDSGRLHSNDEKRITSVLGYKWDKFMDTLYCDVSYDKPPEKVNKRTILSILQQVYDPIGFTCPATLPPKLLLQRLWMEKVSWDEELKQEHRDEFLAWCQQIPDLQKIQIPRNMRGINHLRENWQLHTFSDGSSKAYSAVVYLRSEGDEGKVTIQLLQAKARVAPLKKTTINRLELLGCFIAATLSTSVIEALDLKGVPTYYWSDSTTALAWIKDNDEWGTFVGNRVKTICSLTKAEDWRHVPGALNPADLPSRGCSPTQLLKEVWYEGPQWLKEPPEEWPRAEENRIEEEVLAEKKKSSITALTVISEKVTENPWYARSSSYHKNLKHMAWMIRFINYKIRKTTHPEPVPNNITPEEYDQAEMVILRLLQKDTIPLNQATIAGLPVCKLENDDGLLHVKTRLSNRLDTEGFKFPIILPHDHPITDQLIRMEHLQNKHGGAQFLMSHLREKYWIIQGRKAIRKILKTCGVCRRFTAKRNKLAPSALPEDRVKSSKAFEITGVDLAGPLFTTNQNKSWIVLFTCAVYRCVHLELIQSLSTPAFLDAFTRFTSRRGRPNIMYSDNGTNFVGADNAFNELDWDKITRDHGLQRIKWKFNPPAAPWWGGWWERLVGSVKGLLRRSLKNSRINSENLRTILCEIESVINNRPLTFVTEDPEDFRPLTPAMFLHELPCPGVSDQSLLDASGFQQLHKSKMNVLEMMKMRFRAEYFALLVHRGKAIKGSRQIQVGEVVLIGADNLKRWEWPMGRILKTIPGKDGIIRVVHVKTSGGVLMRPIQHIYPMEISSPQDVPICSLQDLPEDDDVLEEDQEELVREAIDNPEEPGVYTRVGRKVKVPQRYGESD